MSYIRRWLYFPHAQMRRQVSPGQRPSIQHYTAEVALQHAFGLACSFDSGAASAVRSAGDSK
jgi:hypothetical protein